MGAGVCGVAIEIGEDSEMRSNGNRVRHFMCSLPENILHPSADWGGNCLVNADLVNWDRGKQVRENATNPALGVFSD